MQYVGLAENCIIKSCGIINFTTTAQSLVNDLFTIKTKIVRLKQLINASVQLS